MNRRTFTLSSLAAASAAANPSGMDAFAASAATRPKVGLIGCGWFGGVVLSSMAEHMNVEFISLCDPNTKALGTMLGNVAKHQKQAPRTFADYRQMLASATHDIVIVSTPDHWHALPAIAAMKSGADVILEKPVSADVIEGEALVAAARKYERVVQVNTQRRSTPPLVEAKNKYIRGGRLGAIGLVEVYSYLPSRPRDIMADAAPPSHLDYELWTGPAPMRPFKAALESRSWRAFMEYGNGQIGDLGIHMFDCARWMLDLRWPSAISSTGGIYVDKQATSNISDTQRSQFRYPGLDVSWEHRTWGAPPMPPRHWTDLWGARFIGERGTLNVTLVGYHFTPADGGPREGNHMLSKTGDWDNLDDNKFAEASDVVQWRHIEDFMKARATRSRPVADIEEGHISSACCILANLALDLDRPLSYDPATRTIPGDREATSRLARAYRAPWLHPDPARV